MGWKPPLSHSLLYRAPFRHGPVLTSPHLINSKILIQNSLDGMSNLDESNQSLVFSELFKVVMCNFAFPSGVLVWKEKRHWHRKILFILCLIFPWWQKTSENFLNIHVLASDLGTWQNAMALYRLAELDNVSMLVNSGKQCCQGRLWPGCVGPWRPG